MAAAGASQVATYTGSSAVCDTYVSSANGSAHAAEVSLDAGLFPGNDLRRTLLGFDLSTIPQGAAISSARLQLYLWRNTSTSAFAMSCGPLLGSWTPAATWSSTFGNHSLTLSPGVTTLVPAGAGRFVTWDVGLVVQKWFDGSLRNTGFAVTATNDLTASQHSFFSSEISSPASMRPQLVAEYTPPSVSAAPLSPVYRPGSIVRVRVHATSRRVSNLQARVDGRARNGSIVTQALFAYTTTPQDSSWASKALPGGGYLSYQRTPSPGAAGALLPDLDSSEASASPTGVDVTFAYRIGAGHGDVQANRVWVKDADWQTAWQQSDSVYNVVPSSVASESVTTSASASWFQERDANGNGTADSRDDEAATGRGAVRLAWTPAPAASSYDVYAFDGARFRRVASTEATAWSSAGARLFPSDSAIASMSAGAGDDPFAGGGGLDLRDDPTPLYRKTAPGQAPPGPCYLFKVVAANNGGTTDLSETPTVTVALEGRTVHLHDEPGLASVDAGELFGDTAAIALAHPALTLDAVDLTLPSAGPELRLARHYSSATTQSTTFGPGWRFDFEQRIEPGAQAAATYIDADGRRHEFVRDGDAWVAPHGDTDVLTGRDGEGWSLEHKDRSSTLFAADGRLVAVKDASGNAVAYDWTPDSLTVRAPGDVWLLHERRLQVTLRDGKVVSATLKTPDGVRTVNYDSLGTTCTVSANPGTSAARAIVYGYRDGRLATVAALDAPGAARASATWTVTGILGDRLCIENTSGGDTPPQHQEVTWGPAGRATRTIAGAEAQSIVWDALGREVARSIPASSAQTLTGYDIDGNVVSRTTPAGRLSRSAYDGRGNLVEARDEADRPTEYRYSGDCCVEETDPRGAVTTRVFDDRGDLVRERKTLDASGTESVMEQQYDAVGRLTSEREQIDAGTWAQTDYLDFADCGEPSTIVHRGVRLARGAAPVDLVDHRSFDAFGNELRHVDASGAMVAQTAWDEEGRATEVTDAAGTVTHHRYGLLGGEIETWRSNPATSTVANWSVRGFNGSGQLTTETAKASDGSTVSVTAHVYDAAGREIKTDASDVPGVSVTAFDANGNVGRVWAEGADTSTVAASAGMRYDADGSVVSQTAPGSVSRADEFGYAADGSVAWDSDPDGRVTTYVYDAAGDLAEESQVTAAGVASAAYATDLDGRTTSETALADGTTTTHAYDLAGNEVSTRAGGQGASSIERNTLGWELRRVDPDGTVTDTEYDADGRPVAVRCNGQVTSCAYDQLGREVGRTNADGSALEHRFDEFGRPTLERHACGGADVSRVTSVYDSAGRLASTRDDVLGVRRTYSYGCTGTTTVTRTQPDGSSATEVIDGTGLLRSTVATLAGVRVDCSATATDSAGRVVDASSTVTKAARARAYDEAGHLVRDAVGEYTFASGGLKTAEMLTLHTPGASEQNQYGYDALGHLIQASTGGRSTAYSYLAGSGALATISRSGVTTTLAYDAAGRLASASSASGKRLYQADAGGHRLFSGPAASPQQTHYAWAGERLASVAGPVGVVRYLYDAEGQRLRSTIESGSAVTNVTYAYDGTRLASVSASSSQGVNWAIVYVADATGRQDSGAYRSGSGAPVVFSLATTDRGDVRELLDAAGAPFALYSYDAYGNPTTCLTSATSLVGAAAAREIATRQPLRYAGYVWDAETGLYYLGQRYYDPAVAAFISRDPQKADAEASPYQYCAGDPIQNTDPAGLSKVALRTGALSASLYDDTRERVVFGAVFAVQHAKGYAPDNHTQGYKSAPTGYTDCSGLVTWLMTYAGVFPRSSITNWNSRSIFDHAPVQSTHPTNGAFDSKKKTPWRIGDILQSDAPNNHVAIVVKDSPDPYIAESSPTYGGPAIHKLSKRKTPWKFQHAGRFFSKKKG